MLLGQGSGGGSLTCHVTLALWHHPWLFSQSKRRPMIPVIPLAGAAALGATQLEQVETEWTACLASLTRRCASLQPLQQLEQPGQLVSEGATLPLPGNRRAHTVAGGCAWTLPHRAARTLKPALSGEVYFMQYREYKERRCVSHSCAFFPGF